MARNLSSVRNVGLRESVDQIIRQSQRDAARAAGDTDIEPRQFLTQQEQLTLQREGLKQWNDYLRAVATYRDSETKSLKEELALKTQALKTLEGIGRAGQQAGATQNRVNIAGNLSLASENNELAIKALEEMAADLPAKDEATVLNLANDIETGNWGTSIQDIVDQNPALFIEHYPAVMARLGDVLGTTPASLERVLIDESTSTNQPQITRIFTEGQRRHAGALDRIEELLDTAERAENAADRLITSTPESREAFALAKQILDADPNNPDATLQSLGAEPGTAMDDLPGSEMYEQFLKTVGDVETEVYARQLFEATINDPLFNEYVRSQGYDPEQLSFGQKEQLLTPLITQRRREQGRDFVAGQAYIAAQTLAALDPRDDVTPTFTEVLDALIMGSTRPFKVIRELRRLGKQKRVRQVQQELQRQADQGIVPTEVEQDLPRVSAEEQQQATENLRRATEAAEAGETPAAAEAEAAPEAPAEAPTEAAPETRMPSQAVIDSLQSNADRFGARPTIQLDSGEEVFVIPDGGGKLYQMVDGQLQEYAPAGAPEPAAPEAAPQPATSLEQAGATNIVSPAGDPYGPYGQFEDGSVGFMRDGKLVRVRPGQRGYDSIRSVLSGGEALPAGGALPEGEIFTRTSDSLIETLQGMDRNDPERDAILKELTDRANRDELQVPQMEAVQDIIGLPEGGTPKSLFSGVARDINYRPLELPEMASAEEMLAGEEAPTEPPAVAQGEGKDPFRSFLPFSPTRGEEASAETRTAEEILRDSRRRRLQAYNPNMERPDSVSVADFDEPLEITATPEPRTSGPIRAPEYSYFPEEGAGVTEITEPLEVTGRIPDIDFSALSPEEAIREAQVMDDYLKSSGLSPEEAYQEMERRVYSKNPEVFGRFMLQPMGTQEDIDRLRSAGGRPAGPPTRVAPLEISRQEIERDREAFDDPQGDAETASRIMRESRQRQLRTYNPTAQNPEQEAAAEEGVTIPSTRVAPLEIQGDSPPVRVAPLEIKGEARETLEPAETYSPSAEREEAQEAAASDEEDAAVEATETPAPEPAQTEFQNEPEEAKKEEEEEEEEEKEQAAAPRRGRQGLPDSGGRPSGGMAPPSGRSGGSQPRSPAKATLFEEQKMGVAANPGAQITGPPNLSSAESLVGTKKPITNQRNTLALRLAESAQKKAGQMGGMA